MAKLVTDYQSYASFNATRKMAKRFSWSELEDIYDAAYIARVRSSRKDDIREWDEKYGKTLIDFVGKPIRDWGKIYYIPTQTSYPYITLVPASRHKSRAGSIVNYTYHDKRRFYTVSYEDHIDTSYFVFVDRKDAINIAKELVLTDESTVVQRYNNLCKPYQPSTQ